MFDNKDKTKNSLFTIHRHILTMSSFLTLLICQSCWIRNWFTFVSMWFGSNYQAGPGACGETHTYFITGEVYFEPSHFSMQLFNCVSFFLILCRPVQMGCLFVQLPNWATVQLPLQLSPNRRIDWDVVMIRLHCKQEHNTHLLNSSYLRTSLGSETTGCSVYTRQIHKAVKM